ncbi:hypothetical protein NEMBOFW57_007684 [Staphylotrichum longicolle]|uniref:Uncharacterized protein n=1 Tax=Staphylotrichum longicolle TaxID=669026 RepID=A0AAD4EVN5_9PEZI|nr:hypothetical protein NEMBOFW57_007684 [Staphylotrichum longicolle]
MQTSSTTTTSYNPPPLPHASPRPIPDPKFEPLHGGPIPNYNTYTQQHQQHQQHQQQPPPTFPPPPITSTTTTTTTALANTSSRDSPLTEARDATVSALREWIATRRQHVMVNRVNGVGSNGVGVVNGVNGAGMGMGKVDQVAEVEGRLRVQTGVVLAGLRGLQGRVGEVVRAGEGGRWRRVFIGGVIASFIPLVKKLFRRPKHEDESANRTEYAFKKSKGLVARILASTHRPGLGTLAFFVFAVLYVFTNEVSLRVGRTVSKRLRRLVAKVEDGREEVTEDDVKVLQGWRWRILNWSE